MTNYYAEFGLDKGMSLEDIQAILSKERKKWTQRQNAADLERRQVAEKKIVLLDEAVECFNDKWKKEKYDSELAKSGDSASAQIQPDIPQGNSKDELLRSIVRYYDVGNNEQAIELCNNAIALGYTAEEIYSVLGLCYVELGKYSDAYVAFKSGIDKFPKCIEYYVYLSKICAVHLNKLTEAGEILNQAIKIDPNNSYILAAQFEHDLYNGKKDKAISDVKAYLSAHPEDKTYRENISEAYLSYSDIFITYTDNGAAIINSVSDMNNMFDCRQKAKEIYPSERTNECYTDIEELKKTVFNKSNLYGILLMIATGGILLFSSFSNKPINIAILLIGIAFLAIAGLSIWKSIEPVWQIKRNEALGKRTVVGWVSWIVLQWWLWSWRIAKWLIRFIISLFSR